MGGSRLDREAERFEEKPVGTTIRWGVVLILVCSVLIVVGGVAHFALGWLGAAAEVAGPANVKTQYTTVIEDWNAMEVAAQNACAAENSKGSKQGPVFLEDPAFAYKAQYRHITVDYNRRQNNLFEAKVVGPSGYPRVAPQLEEMQAEVC